MTTIYILTHKAFTPPPDTLYQPLQVGACLHEDLGYLRDDDGENISDQNPFFSELTGHYWIWKNDTESDIIGCCHYRRFLIKEDNTLFQEAELKAMLSHNDIITTKLLTLSHSYYEAFDDRHNKKDLDILGEVLSKLQPEYSETYKRIVHSNRTYFGNMFIMKRERFHHYMEFLFPVLFEVQKRVDMSGYDGYQKRLFGFLSEVLLYVYTCVNDLKVKEAYVGMVGEKTETKELKEKLSGYFEKKDIAGAKACFLSYYEKRPDILMEASDINHECRLLMQAISTFEWENSTYGYSRLDTATNTAELITFFATLNELVTAHRHCGSLEDLKKEHLTLKEQAFLQQYAVTETEFMIANRILQPETQSPPQTTPPPWQQGK